MALTSCRPGLDRLSVRLPRKLMLAVGWGESDVFVRVGGRSFHTPQEHACDGAVVLDNYRSLSPAPFLLGRLDEDRNEEDCASSQGTRRDNTVPPLFVTC